MGWYIGEGPAKGKVDYLRRQLGAVKIDKPASFADVPAGKALICVVDNGMFEAAALIPHVGEFSAFDQPRDTRPRTWLLMDKDKAHIAADYRG